MLNELNNTQDPFLIFANFTSVKRADVYLTDLLNTFAP